VAHEIHYYQHAEGGAVHGFTLPLHPEIAKQVRGGELVKVADPDGTDPDTEIARLRAQLEAMKRASGIDPSSLEVDGLADTSTSSDETEAAGDRTPGPDDEDDDEEESAHLCIECGDPVERKGKTGPWPQRHPGCK